MPRLNKKDAIVKKPKTVKTKPAVKKNNTELAKPKIDAVKTKRLLVGVVIAKKSAKTVTILIERLMIHPLYRKRLKRHTKILAHDELDTKEGQKVKILESKPISKRKSWIVTEVIA